MAAVDICYPQFFSTSQFNISTNKGAFILIKLLSRVERRKKMEKLTTNNIMPCNNTSLLLQFTHTKPRSVSVFASKSTAFSLNSIFNSCKTCGGKSAIDCPGCKGTGKNKKNGNIFERWKCYDCQGFGMKSCPSCGKGGLTPEQRGER